MSKKIKKTFLFALAMSFCVFLGVIFFLWITNEFTCADPSSILEFLVLVGFCSGTGYYVGYSDCHENLKKK